MNFEKLKEQFWQDGYIHLPGFFPSEMMEKLNQHVTDHFGVNPDFWHTDEFLQKAQTQVIPWFPQQEGVEDFNFVDDFEDFKTLTDTILGEGWDNLYSMVMFSKKGTVGQAWHQDCPPDVSVQHNLNRLVYTSDIIEEIGGEIVVVPGSHKKGVLPAGDPLAEIEGQKVIRPKQGDLIFLHGHCWHRVLPIKDKYRFSTNYRAAPKGTPENITDICVYRNIRYQFSTNSVVEERSIS